MFLVAEPKVASLHAEVSEYAPSVNTAIVEAHKLDGRYPLSGGALFSIRADHLALHRSVMALCAEGWTFAAAPVLRTMLDLMLNSAIIVNDRDEAEYRGFKYTHAFLKANLNNEAFPEEQRKRMREQVDEGIASLPKIFRDKARTHVYSERSSAYWFNPEFRRPAEAISKLCSPEVSQLYECYSGGSHGGFLGLRILKDAPDDIHPNPRADKRSQNLALCGSIRLTLELFQGCDRFEAGGVNDRLSSMLFAKFRSLESFLRPD